jgi:hypothetical protein
MINTVTGQNTLLNGFNKNNHKVHKENVLSVSFESFVVKIRLEPVSVYSVNNPTFS